MPGPATIHELPTPAVVCGLAASHAVAAASDAGVGASIRVVLGSGEHEVVSEAEVVHLGTGDYVMRSPTHDGLRRRIGPTATVAIGAVLRPAHPLDADVVWRAGLQPAVGDGPDSPSVESSGQ